MTGARASAASVWGSGCSEGLAWRNPVIEGDQNSETKSKKKNENRNENGRAGETRTRDLLTPSQARYQTAPRPEQARRFSPGGFKRRWGAGILDDDRARIRGRIAFRSRVCPPSDCPSSPRVFACPQDPTRRRGSDRRRIALRGREAHGVRPKKANAPGESSRR